MNKKIAIIAIVVVLAFAGCAVFKGIMRTVNDLAESVCSVFGVEEAAGQFSVEDLCTPQEGLDGFSIVQFCAIHKPLSPFIDVILTGSETECAGYGTDVGVLGLSGGK